MQVKYAVLLVLAACGGGVAKEDFGARVQEALCERSVRCGESASMEACERDWVQRASRDWYSLGTRYDAALESGRLRYDEDAAGRCVASIRDGDCRVPAVSDTGRLEGIEYDPTCQVLRAGKPGTDCQWNLECGEQGYCEYSASNACQGRCVPRAQEGETVSRPDACAPGLEAWVGSVCWAPEEGEPQCSEPEGTCDRPVEEGGTCVQTQEDGSSRRIPCAEGLWCDGSGSRRCERLLPEGGTCSNLWESQCEANLLCKEGRCIRRAREGEPCRPQDTSSIFLSEECQRGLYCDADAGQPGTCQKLRAEGDTCRTFGLECAGDMRCHPGPDDSTRGTCGKRPGVGAACDTNDLIPDCAVGLTCSRTYGMCLPVVREGEPCGLLAECDSGTICSAEGRCLPYEAAWCR